MNNYIKDNFLPEDHEQAKEQLDCYVRCTKIALKRKLAGDIAGADAYFNNAERSYKELAELRDKHDKAWYIIKQNKSKRAMDDLIQSQKVVQEQMVDVYV